MLFFATEAGAAMCDGMFGEGGHALTSKINAVASVKVNGLEWAEPTTTQQWREAFGKNGVITETSYSGVGEDGMCTPHHVIEVNYPDKTIYLTLWRSLDEPERELKFTQHDFVPDSPEMEFEALEFNQDFVERGDDRVVYLGIGWNLDKFKDSLMVGEHVIRPDMRFEEFKKLFPLSAQQSLAVLTVLAGWSEMSSATQTQTYIVEVARRGEEACLNQTVEFTFSKGKLSGLALRHYHEWCGC